MAAIRLFLSLLLLAATIPASAQPAFTVQPGTSGAWFDPAKDGQGFIFQVIDARTALTVWYTFDPQGNQAYLVGVGEIQGNRVVMTNLTRTRGGRWGAAFNATQVVREDWGDITFTFANCDRATVVYSPGNSGWPADTLNLQRLTAPRGVGCGNAAPADAPKFLQGAITGAWFDPARDGEGWLVEVISPDLAVAYWFTYTPDGRQAWIGGLGRIVNGSIIVDEATQPIGGRFGPAFNPAQVQRRPWGAFALTVSGCRTAVASSFGPSDYPPFQYANVQQLTSIAGTQPCAFTVGTYGVSGSARAPGGNALDGDVNDPNSPNRDNDGFNQAQPIANPAVVQGFVTPTPTGRTGDRFAAASDEFDVYSTTLVAGQQVRLAIADHDAARPDAVDIDLYLFSAGNTANPVAASEGTGRLESVRVPATGAYFVVVRGFAGESNYTFAVQNTTSAAAALPASMNALQPMRTDTVVAELVQPPGDDPTRNRDLAKAGLLRLGLDAGLGALGQPLLVELGSPAQRAKALARLGKAAQDRPSITLYSDPLLRERFEAIRFVKALRGQDAVHSADPNYLFTASAVPNDPGYRLQWHYPLINLEQAWDLSTGSANVVAAVIDTGVVPHADFGANLRYPLGFDFISSPLSSLDGDGIDANADDPGDRKEPDGSSSFHGTHVGGTMGAASNNGSGVAGVAWSVQLMPVRVLGNGGDGTLFDIAQGMLWAAGLPNASGRVPAQRADVMNLSLGGLGECPQTYVDLVARARAAGTIVVAAAGNESTSQPSTPAACPGVVSVSAIDRVGRLAPYSNFGSTIDVAAPGGDVSVDLDANGIADGVLSLHARGEQANRSASLEFLQGTSMASPHVAGIVALMKSVNPGLTPVQFDALLTTGAITIDLANNGPSVRDDLYGYGVIDAFRAVAESRRLATAAAIPAALSVQPATLDFGDNLTSATLTVANAGQGALTVSGITSTRGFVSVAPLQVSAQGVGTYRVSVDRSGLAPAAYQGELRVASSAGAASVSVGLRVGAQAPGSVGTLYVLLVDANTGVAIREQRLEPANGSYALSFVGVLPGEYFVFAGSDMDNDNFICDEGESCGAFASLAQPSRAVVSTANLSLAPFVAASDTDSLSGLAAASAAAAGASPAVGGRGLALRRSATLRP